MPGLSQPIGATAPKTGTFQFDSKRLQGVPLDLPTAAGTSVTNNRIVNLQQDSIGVMYAVVSQGAVIYSSLVGWGVLEEALQSGGISSIAPSPNNFVNGDLVTVLRDPTQVYMIDYDPDNVPIKGIGTAYLDAKGRLSGSSAGGNLLLAGAVFSSVPGRQMANQLKTGCLFYQMKDPVTP